MADHAWVLENIAAYLTDGLTPSERQDFETHAAGCADCAAALDSARRLDSSLASLFVASRPGPALEDRLIQSLRSQQASWRLPRFAWPLAAAAAVVLLGLMGAVVSHALSPAQWRRPKFAGVPQQAEDRSKSGPPRQSASDLASSWRERIVSELGHMSDERESRTIPDGTSNVVVANNASEDSKEAKPQDPATEPASPSPPASGGGMPGGMPGMPGMPGGMGMMGMMGGMMGGGTGMPAGAAGSSGGGGRGPATNGYYYVTPTAPAGVPQTATDGSPASGGKGQAGDNHFKPSDLLSQTYKEKETIKAQMEHVSKDARANEEEGSSRAPEGQGKGPGERAEGDGDPNKNRKPGQPSATEEPAGPRKIVIRSGEIEFEIDSFDPAVATITLLVHKIRGGFVATVNSEKLANGKVRGSIVVRVPPESLDELILQLRKELGKNGELKTQRVGSQDITKQYTDLESRLRAARAMEERLLQIIKSGKGEIKDLLAAEKELGTWRTRIEEIEGELRYYRNLVSLSTLTITLYEKEIRAPFAVIESERVTMSLEVEEVDEALRAAQKAVLEVKGRITRSELKQHAKGQYSARLDFEVAPDSAGPVRDQLKQLGTVAQLDIDRVEESEGGTGKPRDSKVKRSDARFVVSMYNLTTVAPRETVNVSVVLADPETTFKALLAGVEKAAGRILSSSMQSPKPDQTLGNLQFEVKPAAADALLAQIKSAGEVINVQVTENPSSQDSTRKKRGFNVQLLSLGAVTARETETITVATRDVPARYRSLQEAIAKAKGRTLNAHLDEKNPQEVQGRLDFEVRRTEESAISAALASAGDVYTRNVSRAQDAPNVVDSKVHWQLTLINQAAIPPRETHFLALEVSDVDQAAANFSALVSERQGRTVESQVSREQDGQVTGQLVYDVPLAKAPELIDRLKAAGVLRVQQASKRADVPDSPLAMARLKVTLSTRSLLRVSAENSFWEKIRDGLSQSMKALAWSLMFVTIGVCFVLPWALILYGVYRLIVRLRRPAPPAAPAAPAA